MENFGSEILTWIQVHSVGELGYAFLFVLLFVIPRLLLRLGIPMALTAFALGVAINFGFNFYDGDNVIPFFSTLGIISLFLFAGLEVDLDELRKTFKPIVGHIGIRAIIVVAITVIVVKIYNIPIIPGVVLALALSTPSTGFILKTLETSKISENQKYWIKLKAISAEIVALGALLVFSQMENVSTLAGSFLIIGLMIVVLPWVLKKLAKSLEKLAPGSEFDFILLLAIISGLITKKLGAYYILGAFLVGMAAGQYKRQSPSPTSDQMMNSLRSFSTFFMPFYFFNSGLKMPHAGFSMEALQIALVFLLITFPIKMGSIIFHRRISFKEDWKDSFAISISLMPNLVFGLVLAEILRATMNLPVTMYGGLIMFSLLITMLSPLIIKFVPNTGDLGQVAFGVEPSEYRFYSNQEDIEPENKQKT